MPRTHSAGRGPSSLSRLAGASFWIVASLSSLRFGRLPRLRDVAASVSPARARVDGLARGPPYDFGCRGSFRIAVDFESQVRPVTPRFGAGADQAMEVNSRQSTAAPLPLISNLVHMKRLRMCSETRRRDITIPQQAQELNLTDHLRP